MSSDERPSLTDDEHRAILWAAITAARNEGQSEEELAQVLEWASGVRTNEAALNLLLAGKMGAFIRDGEMIWKALQPGQPGPGS